MPRLCFFQYGALLPQSAGWSGWKGSDGTDHSRNIGTLSHKMARVRLSFFIWRHGHCCCIACRSPLGTYIGGIFLAFPGIFPCGVSMVESHAREHKKEAGMHGDVRGRQEASLESVGASAGAAGLAAFAGIVWWGATRHSLWLVLPTAVVCWCIVSFALWLAREHL